VSVKETSLCIVDDTGGHIGLALERFFHGMLCLRSRRQMLRQAIITSKTANAIVVANTVIIVANERTYITPYSNVRNMLSPAPS
jgi:hypothetical protein